ncbi:MAG: Holliday junction resolvase RuvX [Clostridia bacterium]|nr:Holliday junction resolvase RuvX [Clostridia bacterium]
MALDLGDRRLGIAVSDPAGLTAQPYAVWPVPGAEGGEAAKDGARAFPASEELLARVVELARSLRVQTIVVGVPRDLRGTYGPRAQAARSFADRLRAVVPPGVAVEEWDERLTTAMAERALLDVGLRRRRRREVRDEVAAAVILAGWLDRHRPSGYTTS